MENSDLNNLEEPTAWGREKDIYETLERQKRLIKYLEDKNKNSERLGEESQPENED